MFAHLVCGLEEHEKREYQGLAFLILSTCTIHTHKSGRNLALFLHRSNVPLFPAILKHFSII